MQEEHHFQLLTPGFIMDAVESQGFLCDCRTFALNSYENRVYQVGIEDSQPLIVKFYRPKRWSDEQILEEHKFCFELYQHELPVVPPWVNPEEQSLFSHEGFRFSIYERKGGHAPEFDNPDNLVILGRMIGRIHRIGAIRPFDYRPWLNSDSFGHLSVQYLLDSFIPLEYRDSYKSLTKDLLQAIDSIMGSLDNSSFIRSHGDCHSGNILWRDDAPHFVDFDDSRMAPAVQDLWMMLSGERAEKSAQLSEILSGYTEFYDFNPRELLLIEALRTLRMLHYSAWLGRRWNDPTFPVHFPWFNTIRYWGEHILELREQMSALNEPALQVY